MNSSYANLAKVKVGHLPTSKVCGVLIGIISRQRPGDVCDISDVFSERVEKVA